MNNIFIPENQKENFEIAKKEIGANEYNQHLRCVFQKPVLDYVKTIVINLPNSCYANCSYCIDSYLRKNTIKFSEFKNNCKKVFEEFSNIKEISITGGSLPANEFNELIKMILEYYPDVKITWNTNGIMIDEKYDISSIKYINLHRNSIKDNENKRIFQTSKSILSIVDAKNLFKEKLYLRITVDENFNIDDYTKLGIPLYINRMLPKNQKTELRFNETLKKLEISKNTDVRRRNKYLKCKYKNVPIRICLGDELASHVPNRYPVFLNVVIIHRSGRVCGSWYEDDKVLF